MLSGPEMDRLLKRFEEEYLPDDDIEVPENFQHHEHGLSTKKTNTIVAFMLKFH